MTETHFQPGGRDPQGRMGRLIVFLSNMGSGHGIASKSTAVNINPDGSADVVAAQGVKTPTMAHFVTPTNVALQKLNQPLSWQGITVIRRGGRDVHCEHLGCRRVSGP